MAAGQGINTWTAVGEETVYGTPVARTKFVEHISNDMKFAQEIKFRQSLGASASKKGYWPAGKKVTGPSVHELVFQGYEKILKQCFGSGSSAAEGGTAAYKHSFVLNNTKPIGLTVEVCKDIKSSIFEGCKIVGWKFSGKGFDPIMLNLDWLGEDETNPMPAPSTPTFPGDFPVIPTKSASTLIKFDGGSVDVEEWELECREPHTDDRYKIGNGRTFKEPVRTGFREVVGSALMEFESITLYTKFQAVTEATFQAIYVGDLIATGYYNTFDLNCTRIVFTGETPPVSGPGPIKIKLPFEAMYDVVGVKDAVTLDLTNLTTAI